MDKYAHPQFMLDVEVRAWVLLLFHALIPMLLWFISVSIRGPGISTIKQSDFRKIQ